MLLGDVEEIPGDSLMIECPAGYGMDAIQSVSPQGDVGVQIEEGLGESGEGGGFGFVESRIDG